MTLESSIRGRYDSTRLSVALGAAILLCGGARADCLCGTAADVMEAERAGLQREWLLQVPFDASTSAIEHVVIDRDLVVVQTGDGNVIAVQAGDQKPGLPLPGTILWKHPIDGDARPFQAAAVGTDIVAVAHGDGIHAFDRVTGLAVWDRRFSHLADAGAAVSGSWVYTPFGDGKMMRLPTNPNRGPQAASEAASDDAGPKPKQAAKPARKKPKTGARRFESLEPRVLEAAGTVSLQPQPFKGGVLWCTEGGTLVVLDPSEDAWRRNEFFLDQAPAGRPLVHDDAIFAATAAGDLVRIDPIADASGSLRLTWRVLLDTRPPGTMFVSGEKLVVPLGQDGLAAYSTKTGDLLWRSAAVGRVVAVAAGRVWLVDRMERLVGLDLETAERRDLFCLGGFTVPVANQATDRLILASPAGAIVSLKAR
ncbi:MAG: hypothetical protein EBR28_07350 [Planctomycetia bacterium]|nr:hypothetical protein [Planctomycetia bacterium]